MNTKEYQKKYNELKSQQTPLVNSYNRTKNKESKKNYYKLIMEYEVELYELELQRRK